MVRKVLIPVLFVGSMLALPPAAADDTLVKFKGGIGVIPVSSGVVVAPAQPLTSEAVNRNFVRNVPPAGQIWVIDELEAEVAIGGQIKVKGKGLILGGGNNAGRATGQFVFATLICEAAPPFTELNTNLVGVQLAPNGDFEIDDRLTPSPSACPSPMLLIRNAAGLTWFAVGIVKFGD